MYVCFHLYFSDHYRQLKSQAKCANEDSLQSPASVCIGRGHHQKEKKKKEWTIKNHTKKYNYYYIWDEFERQQDRWV